MKVTTRRLRRHLEHLGTVPVPPPSPGFAARTEEHLRSLRTVPVLAPAPRAPRRRIRPAWVPVAVAVAAVGAVVGLAIPRGGHRVVVTTGGGAVPSTSTSAPEPPSTTTVPTPATTAAPTAPATTTSTTPPATRPRPAPTTTTAAPATTTTTVAPPRPVETTTAPTTRPPEPPTTTTTAPPVLPITLQCSRSNAGPPYTVSCTWSAVTDPAFAGWRLFRAVGTNPKQVAFTSTDPAARSWTDADVTQGNVYHYLVEALAGDGRTIARSAVVEVVV